MSVLLTPFRYAAASAAPADLTKETQLVCVCVGEEMWQLSAQRRAYRWRVFPDAGGEHESIESAEDGRIWSRCGSSSQHPNRPESMTTILDPPPVDSVARR